MSLFEAILPDGRRWARVGDFFEVTRKPRGQNLLGLLTIPFVPMEAIPQGGVFEPKYEVKPVESLSSGTYFERGDLLIAKITPSFENGKQAVTDCLPATFGYATTEVIPLRLHVAGHDKRLLFFYLLHPDVRSYVAERMEGSTGRQRVPESVLMNLPYPEIPTDEQCAIADTLGRVCMAAELEKCGEHKTKVLKHAAMRELFTRGPRGEPQKESEIGLVPVSWTVGRLDQYAQVVSTRMTYSELETAEQNQANGLKVIGIKVSDMNREGNEIELRVAALEKLIDAQMAFSRCAPPGTIVFPKRGAAIATNKKRLTAEWSVFDPNVIGVVANESVNARLLFHWFQTFDLRTITEPGPTPQLNKKHLDPLPLPIPGTVDEQREIVAILDAIDRKSDLHRRKCAVLDELFKVLLHKLMTGEIRVSDLDLSALADDLPTSGAAA